MTNIKIGHTKFGELLYPGFYQLNIEFGINLYKVYNDYLSTWDAEYMLNNYIEIINDLNSGRIVLKTDENENKMAVKYVSGIICHILYKLFPDREYLKNLETMLAALDNSDPFTGNSTGVKND